VVEHVRGRGAGLQRDVVGLVKILHEGKIKVRQPRAFEQIGGSVSKPSDVRGIGAQLVVVGAAGYLKGGRVEPIVDGFIRLAGTDPCFLGSAISRGD